MSSEMVTKGRLEAQVATESSRASKKGGQNDHHLAIKVITGIPLARVLNPGSRY